jgi:UDPglucose 6-dehydrogenase
MQVLRAVENVNDAQKSVLFDKLSRHFASELRGLKIAVWGLSFKPQTDDMREAPSLVLIEKLLAAGCQVKAYDPVAMKEAAHTLGDSITYAKDEYDALLDADALLVVTEWPDFRSPNFDVVARLMKQKVIFDGRNIYDAKEMKAAGFAYHCIGVRTAHKEPVQA